MTDLLDTIDTARGLAAVAQIGLGFTGFIAVVVTLSGNPRAWPAIDRLRVASMLAASLATMLFALLPFALVGIRLPLPTSFRIASALLAVFLTVSATWVTARIQRGARGVVSPGIVALTTSLRGVMVALQLGNALGSFGAATGGVFFFGLIWLLAECGFLLVRLIFVRPE